MSRVWHSGPSIAVLDEGGVSFDTRGTPMDQDWFCRLDELAGSAQVLRQTWSEEMLVELFAEAAKLQPGIPPLPPPVPRPPPASKPRRARAKKPAPPLPPPPLPALRGFDTSALEALAQRAIEAARLLDPTFPAAPGPLRLESRDLDEREERLAYRAGTAEQAISLVLTSEMQDGLGGPVARPASAHFNVLGLPSGCALHGQWDGRSIDATVEGPTQTGAQALAWLRRI